MLEGFEYHVKKIRTYEKYEKAIYRRMADINPLRNSKEHLTYLTYQRK